ncbi:hypothetical protein [Phenylobacterium sp.]|uniref:hypothetical protein n=1 Tax=Phenylobacterium sp. TaxID=1871053 RepID=UPI002737DBF5|nr:hypothetical protein [Phenylobacterium sp.]MDP3870405.1 hypothetical protein [Phenylobacterium sp.]
MKAAYSRRGRPTPDENRCCSISAGDEPPFSDQIATQTQQVASSTGSASGPSDFHEQIAQGEEVAPHKVEIPEVLSCLEEPPCGAHQLRLPTPEEIAAHKDPRQQAFAIMATGARADNPCIAAAVATFDMCDIIQVAAAHGATMIVPPMPERTWTKPVVPKRVSIEKAVMPNLFSSFESPASAVPQNSGVR